MISIRMEQAPDTEANQNRDKRSGEPRPSSAPSRFVALGVGRRDARRKCRRQLRPEGPSQSILLGGSPSAVIDFSGVRSRSAAVDLRMRATDMRAAAIVAYEAAMFPRSRSAAVDAHRILALCLDDRSPFSLVDFFTNAPARNREGATRP
jgi:hypothetical protein